MSFLDDVFGAVNTAADSAGKVINVASAAVDAKLGWQTKKLDNQVKLTNAKLQADLARINAENQKAVAANSGYFDLMGQNLSTGISNLQSRVNSNGSNTLMTFVAIASLAVAIMQYQKGR